MSTIAFNNQSYLAEAGETVLEALLRQGVETPHGCQAGTCGACMLRAETGVVPAKSQLGLKETWKARGYFLPCVCVPESDLGIGALESDVETRASIILSERLSEDVVRVRVQCEKAIVCRPGQYVTLLRAGGVARSYSIASITGETELEFHVRRVANGRMSGWLHTEARAGDQVSVRGPMGECFYVAGNADQPLLLVGTGTGLAPLYGILRDALRTGHRGSVQLFHGALHKGGLYLVEELRRLAAEHANFEYTPTVLRGSSFEDVTVGALDEIVLGRLRKLNGWRTYICGDPALVQSLKKKFFLAGVASRDIYADAFLPAK